MTDGLEIHREDGGTKGRYAVRVDGHEAEMTCSRTGASTIANDHTGVPDPLRGRGGGQALLRRGVEDARAEGRTIVPLWLFAKRQIARPPEWQDVLEQ